MSCNPAESERIRVLVVDDQQLYAQGTVALLGIEPRILVVGVARNGTECLCLVGDTRPHVVLLDIDLLYSNEINYIAGIKKVQPGTKIIIMTGQNLQDYISLTMKKGPEGILLKDCSFKEMTQAIFRVAEGGICFPQSSEFFLPGLKNGTRLTFSPKLTKDKLKLLTTKEIEIMELVVEGFHNKEIAGILGLKVRAVDLHFRNILSKLEVSTRFEAALWWAYVDNKAF
ncbi:MAG: response regulator transcription factor [Desulfitobacteriaceae bacterium]|nr:response regulator transcription factor [Desulfitobacteriaceae bacterium]MDD4345987.1 response regulator transcription factor [Desulfitobacteriaceae bacterium]MDD4400384.1 response regulator transcription factor [Desulfitobacteriaceae bacterium]